MVPCCAFDRWRHPDARSLRSAWVHLLDGSHSVSNPNPGLSPRPGPVAGCGQLLVTFPGFAAQAVAQAADFPAVWAALLCLQQALARTGPLKAARVLQDLPSVVRQLRAGPLPLAWEPEDPGHATAWGGSHKYKRVGHVNIDGFLPPQRCRSPGGPFSVVRARFCQEPKTSQVLQKYPFMGLDIENWTWSFWTCSGPIFES